MGLRQEKICGFVAQADWLLLSMFWQVGSIGPAPMCGGGWGYCAVWCGRKGFARSVMRFWHVALVAGASSAARRSLKHRCTAVSVDQKAHVAVRVGQRLTVYSTKHEYLLR